MEKTCPHCAKTFTCKHEDIATCWCMTAEIHPDIMTYISEKYPNKCLCKSCMDELHRILKKDSKLC